MSPVNICLIGHRGVGKSTFLARVARGRRTFDLDAEIARADGRSVARIFGDDGESAFRAVERATLADLLARPGPKVIAIGAGFEGPRPAGALIVWLRRPTDQAGRVFLDRPRLNASVSPLAEYLERFAAREARYRAWADLTLLLPEGYDGGLEDFLDLDWRVPFDVTLPAAAPWPAWGDLRASWAWRRLEVRDDLITAPVAPRNVLRSYRRGPAPPAAAGEEDWALELGVPPREFAITSVHEGDVAGAIPRLAPFARGVQKLAVEVRTFDELRAGHRWWADDPNRRAFLPRDAGGRWRWYRSLFGPRMPLHFVREDEGSALDQPPLWQVRLQTTFDQSFAAVLGSPIEHSRTPLEHREFFAARGEPVVAIEVTADEWPRAIPVLRELGLRAAAVTAPLKPLAFALATDHSGVARATGAANTLSFEGPRIWATNTDVIALERIARDLGPRPSVWLWGGGGVKSSVRAAWPHAREISARAGVGDEIAAPDLLVWAVGRVRAPRAPPPGVRPRLVLDLNYADDSPGLEFATVRGLPYQSGLAMFKLQAQAQRDFWTAREGPACGEISSAESSR